MRRVLLVFAAVAVVLAAAFFGVRSYLYGQIEAQSFETRADGPATPAEFGASYTDTTFTADGRQVQARFVEAGPEAPAVLILHGNGETLSSWARAQAFLRARGVSSLVFDYAGYGASTGEATVDNVTADARRVYAAFDARFAGQRRYVLGHSLGTGVALDAAPSLTPPPDGYVLSAPFPSARAAVARHGLIDARWTWLLPDVWNNVEAIGAVEAPVLVVRGADDPFVPAEAAREVAASGTRTAYATLPEADHTTLFRAPSAQVWAPILAFIRTGTLP